MNPEDFAYYDEAADRPRSKKDTVPEFKDGEDALEWMNSKLDGSWVDAVTGDPKERGAFEVVEPIPNAASADQALIDEMFKKMLGQ